MSGEWWNKIKQVIGIPGEDDFYEVVDGHEESGAVAVAEKPAAASAPTRPVDQPTLKKPAEASALNQMIGLSSALTQSEVMIIEPKSFEDALAVVQSLREHRAVIMNMKELTAEQAQRLLDFVSGAAHAVDGNQKQIGEGIFLFSPSNVVINPLGAEQPWLNRDARDLFWRVK